MFPSDFDADTGHLSFAEDGAYNRLLRLQWRCPMGKMPADLDWIFRKVRAVTEADQAMVAAIVKEFFTRKGGKIFSARLLREWAKAEITHEKKISAGSKGAAVKALKNNKSEARSATAQLKQPEPEPEPEESKYSEDKSSGEKSPDEDFAKQVFDRAVSFLGRHGTKESQARAFVGKLRKAHSDTDIFAAFSACGKAGVVDPIPWITAKLVRPKTDLDAAFAQFAVGTPQ